MLTSDLSSAAPAVEACSPAMRAALGIVATVALHDVPVLFRGECGSGKSVLARALHAASARRAAPLVSVDCQALHGEGLASAHALVAKLRDAAGGTILLEEIGALPRPLQAAVASLIDRPHGASVDVRVVATTQRDLEAAVREGHFNGELLTCVGVVEIRVAPLRERREDILPLARRFLGEFIPGDSSAPELTPRAQRALLAYAWPGNVRELRSAMQRALIVSRTTVLDLDAFPPRLSSLG